MEEVEKLRKQNKELKEELKMIEMFYGENSLMRRIKFYIKYIKEKWKNANSKNTGNNDTSGNNTIYNNRNVNSWNNEIDKLFNNEKVEKEKEFISYLEDKIYSIEPKGTGINYNCEYDSEEDYVIAMQEQSRLNTLKEILKKYKEIIGDKE